MADDFYRARSTFVCNTGKGLRTVRKDSLLSGDDPAVRNAPHLFQSVSDAVEQATAAPGERRTLSSPHLLREAARKATGRRGGKKAPEQPNTDDGEGQGDESGPADEGATDDDATDTGEGGKHEATDADGQ